jgi:uncharacterized membrane protein YjgN (DUF898 family)
MPVAMLASQGAFMVAIFFIYAFMYGYINAHMQNYIYNNTKLESGFFNCTLKPTGLASLYITNTIAIVFSLGMLIPWALVRTARYRADNLSLHIDDPDQFAQRQQQADNALGEEVGEMFDADIGI